MTNEIETDREVADREADRAVSAAYKQRIAETLPQPRYGGTNGQRFAIALAGRGHAELLCDADDPIVFDGVGALVIPAVHFELPTILQRADLGSGVVRVPLAIRVPLDELDALIDTLEAHRDRLHRAGAATNESQTSQKSDEKQGAGQ